jgi:hypothetical protein
MENCRKKDVCSLEERLWSTGHPVPKNIGFMGIKIRRILRRFQKYELTLVAKEI